MFDPKNPSLSQEHRSEKALLLAVAFLMAALLGTMTALQGVAEPVALAFWVSLYLLTYILFTWTSE